MAEVRVEEATQEHVDAMIGRLRKADEEECWASAHITADEGLQRSFNNSRLCWTAFVDDVPTLCFGVGAVSLLSDVGRPWLLGTDDIAKIGLRVVRHSRRYIYDMLDRFSLLENW